MPFTLELHENKYLLKGPIGVVMKDGAHESHVFIFDTGFTNKVLLSERLFNRVRLQPSPPMFSLIRDETYLGQNPIINFGNGESTHDVTTGFIRIQGREEVVHCLFYGENNMVGLPFFKGKTLQLRVEIGQELRVT